MIKKFMQCVVDQNAEAKWLQVSTMFKQSHTFLFCPFCAEKEATVTQVAAFSSFFRLPWS